MKRDKKMRNDFVAKNLNKVNKPKTHRDKKNDYKREKIKKGYEDE
jgi:hypothetical protein